MTWNYFYRLSLRIIAVYSTLTFSIWLFGVKLLASTLTFPNALLWRFLIYVHNYFKHDLPLKSADNSVHNLDFTLTCSFYPVKNIEAMCFCCKAFEFLVFNFRIFQEFHLTSSFITLYRTTVVIFLLSIVLLLWSTHIFP